jgi:O-antigen ligase
VNLQKDAAVWAVAAAAVAAAVSVTACEVLMGLSMLLLLVTRTPWRVPPVWLPLVLFMAGTLVSLAASGHAREGLPQVKKFFVYLMLVLVFTAFRTVRDLFLVAAGWAAALALSAADGLWQFAQKWNAYNSYVTNRITGFSTHWMTFSGQLMIGILLVAACVLFAGTLPDGRVSVMHAHSHIGDATVRERSWRSPVRCGMAAAVLLMCVALAAAWTRSVWLGTLCGAAYLLWFWRRWALLALPAIVGILLLTNPFDLRQRMVSSIEPHGGADSNEHRAELRQIGWRMIAAHPWLGVGPEQVSHQMVHYLSPGMTGLRPGEYYGHLENDYVQYAAERGVPAMLALMWAIAWALFDFARALRRLPGGAAERWMLHGAIAATIAMLVSGFYSWNLNTSVVLAMFLAVIGCGYVAVAASHDKSAA